MTLFDEQKVTLLPRLVTLDEQKVPLLSRLVALDEQKVTLLPRLIALDEHQVTLLPRLIALDEQKVTLLPRLVTNEFNFPCESPHIPPLPTCLFRQTAEVQLKLRLLWDLWSQLSFEL